jgi:predicted GNAT family acetyltransferase
MAEEFSHNQAANQFEVTIDGRLAGEAHYALSGHVAAFDHTKVPEEFGGRGVAGRLVQHAMDEVRAAGEWKVVPSCPYVAHWFDSHPDYADLLA